MGKIEDIRQKRTIENIEHKLDVVIDRVDKIEKSLMELKSEISEIRKIKNENKK